MSSASPEKEQPDTAGEDEANFDCNICMCACTEPVLTRCGHLYCWPCLYRWLQQGTGECPVCKAGVTKENVIPMYGRGATRRRSTVPPPGPNVSPEQADNANATPAEPSDASSSSSSAPSSDAIPDRPAGERPDPPPRAQSNSFWGGGGGGGPFNPFGVYHGGVGGGNVSVFTMGFGLVPSLLGFALNNMQGGGGGGADGRQQQPQSTFGNMMLLLGLLVVLLLIYS